MRSLVILLLGALMTSGLLAQQSGGVQFMEGEWEKVIAQSKAENKLIFVDAYASWCGPCKLMNLNVFSEPEVGNFYNKKFLNVSMDMEAGQGLEFATNHHINAYPTLLFINGTGKVVHRVTGYHSPEQFLELGKRALDPEHNLAGLKARYEKGERNADFLYEYLLASYEAGDEGHEQLVDEYFSLQGDWGTEKNMHMLFLMVEDTDSELFDYLATYRERFEAMFGEETVVAKIQQLILKKVYSSNSDMPVLEEVKGLFQKAYPEMADKLFAFFQMNYYQYAGDTEQYAEAAVQYLEQFPSNDPNELNNIAWTFYESVNDKELIKKAIKWAEKSVELDSQYYNNDTLASLYYKAGKKKKAIKTAATAISIAKANGEDYSSTVALIEKMKS